MKKAWPKGETQYLIENELDDNDLKLLLDIGSAEMWDFCTREGYNINQRWVRSLAAEELFKRGKVDGFTAEKYALD